jgi:hypothetical protein
MGDREITFEVGTGFAPCPWCGWVTGDGLTDAELWRHFAYEHNALERAAKATCEVGGGPIQLDATPNASHDVRWVWVGFGPYHAVEVEQPGGQLERSLEKLRDHHPEIAVD